MTRSLAEYLRESRTLAAKWESQDQARRIGVLASFSAEFLRPFIIVESAEMVPLLPWFAPFGQFEPIIFGEPSQIGSLGLLWIAMRLEDVDPRLVHEHGSLSPDQTAERWNALTERLVGLARGARERHRGPVLVSNFALPYAFTAGVFDAADPDGLVFQLMDANRRLARELKAINVHVFDYAGMVADVGAASWRDAKLFHAARIPCRQTHQSVFAQRLARAAAALLRPAAKCIVLDLDNTLWGGVLGDDGIEGIELGDDHPGSVYKELQAALHGYRDRGFLLAVASKNDDALVRKMLDTHPEQLLRAKHFAHIEANWEPKPASLRRIAAALNIGLDALVFVDDNPAERAQMRAELPSVHVVELPSDPLLYLPTLQAVPVLDRVALSEEDRARARMYAEDESRRRALETVATSGDFLSGLGMEVEVGLCDETTQNRIHQLIHKTNQFNLTTRRHDIGVLRDLVQSPAARVAWLRLRDRFGDLGLVCVGIIREREPRVWEVDTFLMSCRVMGRRVEEAFVAYLAELATSAGAERLIGAFRPTAANGVVKDFYPRIGFEPIPGAQGDAEQYYERRVSAVPSWPESITRKEGSRTS